MSRFLKNIMVSLSIIAMAVIVSGFSVPSQGEDGCCGGVCLHEDMTHEYAAMMSCCEATDGLHDRAICTVTSDDCHCISPTDAYAAEFIENRHYRSTLSNQLSALVLHPSSIDTDGLYRNSRFSIRDVLPASPVSAVHADTVMLA